MNQVKVVAAALVCLLVLPTTTAFAHPGHVGHEFGDGFQHPLTGLDHLLAMVAVGLLAVRLGGRAIWMMPLVFLASMLAGGLVATANIPVPEVEYGIMASVLVLGLLVASTRVASLRWGAALVGVSAFFHGYAHAAEMVAGGSLGAYAAGFLLATAILHASGIAIGLLLARRLNVTALRVAGGAISAAGALMIMGVL
jgi:urease accessory protein